MDYELRVINKPLYYIELVALLNSLVNDKHSEELRLSAEQESFLQELKGLRIQGLELFEFYLYKDELNSIHDVENLLHSIDKNNFLYLFFGEEVDREELKNYIEHFDRERKRILNNPILVKYSEEMLCLLFQKTDAFKEKLMDIFRVIDQKVAEQMTISEDYKDSIQKVSQELRSRMPLDVAQGIMGKKFMRISDYTSYYFVPSFFYTRKPMRTFDKKSQIVVYPIEQQNEYSKNTLANALRIIGDDTRLEIIEKLAVRPMYGKELAGELELVSSTVSHHLEQLRSIGLINEERVKSVKYFSLNINEYNSLCDTMKSFISASKIGEQQ